MLEGEDLNVELLLSRVFEHIEKLAERPILDRPYHGLGNNQIPVLKGGTTNGRGV